MIRDTRTQRPPKSLSADVCIIGAGVAGITLALELEQTGADVVLLEAGGASVSAAQQQHYQGETTGLNAYDLRESRFRGLGGSSAMWAGRCVPLEPLDFAGGNGADIGWPVTRQEMDPFYRRARLWMGLPPEPTDGLRSQAETQKRLGSDRLEARWVDIRVTKFGVSYRKRLKRSRRITVWLGAQVTKLIANRDGDSVSQAEVATLDGDALRVTADQFVLAAGGIENPRLLLLSELGGDLVGRYFMDHAFIDSAELTDFDHDLWRDFEWLANSRGHSVLTMQEQVLLDEGISSSAVYLLPIWDYMESPLYDRAQVGAAGQFVNSLRRRDWHLVADRFSTAMKDPLSVARISAKRFVERKRPPQKLVFHTVPDQTPNPANRVTLGPNQDAFGMPSPHVHWEMGPSDKRSFLRFHEILQEEIASLGLGSLRLTFTPETDDWLHQIESGKHHMGTTRMTDDPSSGVVDRNSRLHTAENVYVAGSSVFPRYGWANPTLTIAALTVRLADHLAGRQAAQRPAATD